MSSHSRYQKFFADQFKDSWLGFEGFEDYFTSTICNLTSDKFVREKERWEEEETRLLNEQKSLAFKHYQSFVSTAQCSSEIGQSFGGLEVQIDNVIDLVPKLQTTLNNCAKLAVSTTKQRKEANISITKHPQLLEILELPQLIDTSIRNSYFEEGLELHSFVNNLAVKYSDIPIIMMIKEDADACVKHMEDILLKQLQGQITLAACLKSVGLLRRIGSYTDTQLKVKFLEVRTQWFRTIIDNINKEEIQYYMCKMIDSYRVNLFDIITQYRSVFIEDKNTSLIFNSWLHRQVAHFIDLIDEGLPKCSGAVIDSTLAQAMYFGMSLGRVGADFRGALVPIFQRRILGICLQGINQATQQFQRSADTLLDVNTHGQSSSLVNVVPLAVYYNTVTAMLNELRHCAPASLSFQIVAALQSSLSSVIELSLLKIRDCAKLEECVATVLALELLPNLDANLGLLFKTIPEIYNSRSFSNVTHLDKTKLSLNLDELREPLLPYLSPASKILISSQQVFSHEDEPIAERAEDEAVNEETPSIQQEEADKPESEKDASALEKDASALEKDASELEKDASASEKDASELEKDASALEKDSSALEKDASALEKDSSALEKDESALEKDESALEKDASALEKDASELEKDESALEKDASALEKDNLVRAHDSFAEEIFDGPIIDNENVSRTQIIESGTVQLIGDDKHEKPVD